MTGTLEQGDVETTDLEAIEINGVTAIGDSAFQYCSELTSVTFGSSVTSIGESVFDGCDLQSVTIPATVASIGYAGIHASTVTFTGRTKEQVLSLLNIVLDDEDAYDYGDTLICDDGNLYYIGEEGYQENQ